MIQIPAHLQPEFDLLSKAQQQKLIEMAQWGAAGSPGALVITDMAFERCLKYVKQMGEEPVEPIEPDKTVNHDWPQNLIPKK